MKMFCYDGAYARFMGRVFDLMLLHLLWLLCSLPVVTIGASTTALFAVTLKMTKDKESYIVRSYFQAFVSNFGKATKLWLLEAAAFIWILGSLYICSRGEGIPLRIAGIVNAMCLVLLCLTACYVFPIQAKYENKVTGIIKSAFICSLRYLPYTIAIAAAIIIPVLLTAYAGSISPFLIAIWVSIGSSAAAYTQSRLLNMVFQKAEEY